jgi:hypothetical protein
LLAALHSKTLIIPQTEQFQTVSQRFCQFRAQEYNWNTADRILLGQQDLDPTQPTSIGTNPKRLRFTLIPDVQVTEVDAVRMNVT